MFIFIFLIGVLSVFYYLSVNSNKSKFWKLLNAFPGDPTLPIIGNGHQVGTDAKEVQENLRGMWERHGRGNFRVVLGPDVAIMICTPDSVERIMGSSSEIEKGDMYRLAKKWLGNSLVMSKGDTWRAMRKLLTPTFHFKILIQYLEMMNTKSSILLSKLKKHVGGDSFDVYSYISHCFLDNIISNAMGLELNVQSEQNHPFVGGTRSIIKLTTKRWFSFWKRFDILYQFSPECRQLDHHIKAVHKFCLEVIKTRRENINLYLKKEENIDIKAPEDAFDNILKLKGRNISFIDLLLLSKQANGEPLPDQVINDETNLFLFAGHDTTTAATCITIHHLAKYPELQKKALEEQNIIFGDDPMREPKLEDLNQMKYLGMFIKETMRMYPIVAHIGRKLINDLELEDGKVIPAGATVIFYLEGLHNNPAIHPEPHVFNPDRFLEPMHTYAFVPFSAGPRNCIGMKLATIVMKLTLSRILREFEITYEGPEKDPIIVTDLVLTSENGVHIKLKNRKHS